MGFGEINLLSIWDDLAFGINVMLSLRAFKRAMSSPMLFCIEVYVALVVIDIMKEEKDF